MKYLPRLLLFLMLVIPIIAVSTEKVSNEEIDKEFVRKIDVTGDGVPDTILIRIKGKNMKSPFVWSITIMSGDDKIYFAYHDDEWMEQAMKESHIIEGCTGYQACKEKWYFHDLPESPFVVDKKDYDIDGILDKSNTGSLYHVGREFLDKQGVKGEKAQKILKSAENMIRSGKAVMVSFPISPVKNDVLMIFVPEMNDFMPVYED